MSRLSAAVSAIAPSATMAVDAKAKALKASGADVIGFGAGEPDFPTPEHIVAAAAEAAADPRWHKYTPTPGLPALREAIAAATDRDSGVPVDPSQVVVTNGGKHAVYNACAVLLDPGDEVLVPAPYWTSYPEMVALTGARAVELPTEIEDGFRITPERLDAACSDRTKALIFVSPNNPTGTVYPAHEIAAIGRWAVERGIWVITDEIYQHLTYGPNAFFSLPGLVPDIVERCVIVNGVAKTYAMTGWRLGWLVGPPDVATAATTLQSHQTSNVANVAQVAALAALTGPQDCVTRMRTEFEFRGRRMHEALTAIGGVQCLEPQGAFYCFPSLRAFLGRSFDGATPTTTLELCELLLERAGVAIVPGEAFGAPGYARLSFALDPDDLDKGVARLGEFLTSAT